MVGAGAGSSRVVGVNCEVSSAVALSLELSLPLLCFVDREELTCEYCSVSVLMQVLY